MKKQISQIYYRIEHFLFDDIKNQYSFLLFQKTIYVYLVFYVIQLIPVSRQFLGQSSFCPPHNVEMSWGYTILNLLHFPQISQYYIICVVLLISFLFFGILRPGIRWVNFIIYFFTVNLFNKTYLINTGGQYLISIFLFFIILSSVRTGSKRDTSSELNTALSNVAILACKIQLIIVYFFSSFYKYFGSEWLNGNALYYALKVENYSPIWVTSYLDGNNWFLQIGTFVVLAYLTFFPILVWVNKVKLYFLTFGVLIHLGIAFIMGVFDFGIIMVISYLIFIPNDKAKKILNFLRIPLLK